MKKKYVDPEVEIVLIDETDIIFASSESRVCTANDSSCDDGEQLE